MLTESIIKLLVATALGAAVGLEREIQGRPAGLRTNALVCLASALLIIISRTGALQGLTSPNDFMINVDPSRMAAGIVTGIGFLGAGAILRVQESLIRGLTTAATIWFVAAIGVAVGIGAFTLAGVATALSLVILIGLKKLESLLEGGMDRLLVLEVDHADQGRLEASCRELLNNRQIDIHRVDYSLDKKNPCTQLRFTVRATAKHEAADLVSELAALPGVCKVSWS